MRSLTEFSSQIPINSRPQIIRLHDILSPPDEFSAIMTCWSLHFFHIEIRIDIEDVEHWLRPGLALLTPPGIRTHTYSRSGGTQYFAHFLLPESSETIYATAPLVLDMEGEYEKLNGVFRDATGCWPGHRDKAEITLWYLLQALFVPTEPAPTPELPEKLFRALHYITENFAFSGGTAHLARVLAISTRHLNRLFQRQFGITAAEYLREKRLLEARRYLTTSDHMVKEIGALVGIPGAQHFNAMIKKRFGLPPQALREAARSDKTHTKKNL